MNWSILSPLKSRLLQGDQAESVGMSEQPGTGAGTLLGSKVERRDNKRDSLHQIFQPSKIPVHHYNLLIQKYSLSSYCVLRAFLRAATGEAPAIMNTNIK